MIIGKEKIKEVIIKNVRKAGRTALEEAGIETAAFDADYLLAELLNIRIPELMISSNDKVPSKVVEQYRAVIKKRSINMPIQYILGTTHFLGIPMIVTPDVHIPRFDTETLAHIAIRRLELPRNKIKTIFDLGTGSGNIGLYLKSKLQHLKVISTDKNKKVFPITEQNFAQLKTPIKFKVIGDWLDPFMRYFKKLKEPVMIISNPPYINKGDQKVAKEVDQFEPHSAIYSKDNGLHDIKRIITSCHECLPRSSCILLEFGLNQEKKILKWMAKFEKLSEPKLYKDLNGIYRVMEMNKK
ncbi:peptide chain release factor N(5)-glutamine methyltransferase [Candidatus Margulisiibacteriota bacterium]